MELQLQHQMMRLREMITPHDTIPSKFNVTTTDESKRYQASTSNQTMNPKGWGSRLLSHDEGALGICVLHRLHRTQNMIVHFILNFEVHRFYDVHWMFIEKVIQSMKPMRRPQLAAAAARPPGHAAARPPGHAGREGLRLVERKPLGTKRC